MAKSGQKKPVEVIGFADQVEQEFLRLYQVHDIASVPERRKPDAVDSLWNSIYDTVFKPDIDDITYNNCKSKLIPYKVLDVEAVVKKYIDLCRLYGGYAKYSSFCDLVGYHRSTIDLWNKSNTTNGYVFYLNDNELLSELNNIYILYTSNDIEYHGNGRHTQKNNDKLSSLRFDVKKKIQEGMQGTSFNRLTTDLPALPANSDGDLGLLYEPRRMMQQEQVRRTLSLSDLPKGFLADVGGSDAIESGGNSLTIAQKEW